MSAAGDTEAIDCGSVNSGAEETDIACMIESCGKRFLNLWPGTPPDSAARSSGWARFDYPDGPRYLCPESQRPQTAEPRQNRQPEDQLALFGE